MPEVCLPITAPHSSQLTLVDGEQRTHHVLPPNATVRVHSGDQAGEVTIPAGSLRVARGQRFELLRYDHIIPARDRLRLALHRLVDRALR